ncbi:MAG: hypothetical protein RM338_25570 [Nostoc sp. DedQUE12a]|nr:hypothetical protein [Nostoc sp. DedQUE12a]
MKIKTISCERVINTGNYESRRLHLGAEISEDEDVETAITSLMELVERKAREKYDLILDSKDLRDEIKRLKLEVQELQAQKDKLTGQEADPNDIPFNPGDVSNNAETSPSNF